MIMNKRLAESKKKYCFKRVPVKKQPFNIDVNDDFSEIYDSNIKFGRKTKVPKHSTSTKDLNMIQPLNQPKQIEHFNRDVKKIMRRQSTVKNFKKRSFAGGSKPAEKSESNLAFAFVPHADQDLSNNDNNNTSKKKEMEQIKELKLVDYDNFNLIFPFNVETIKISEEMDTVAIKYERDELNILIKRVYHQLISFTFARI